MSMTSVSFTRHPGRVIKAMLSTAERAAEHLELKYARGKRYADSAEAFIERLATGSSWSGEPYWMICDGDKISLAEWLAEQLEGSRTQ